MYGEESAIAIIFILNVQVVYLNILFQSRRLFSIKKVTVYMKKTKGLLAISFIQVQIMSCDSWVPLLLLEEHWSENTNYQFTEFWLVYIYP